MFTRRRTLTLVLLASAVATWHPALGQGARRRALAEGDINDIARLVMMEDYRQLDSAEVARLLDAAHPEVRRRAALAAGRIVDKRSLGLLRARPLDADTAVAATIVFAVGQLKDPSTVAWFDSVLSSARTAPTVAAEAATALGKLKNAAARDVLARFLSTATADERTTAAIGEALLSLGRSTVRGDIAPVLRWAKSPSVELRWRVTWALFRSRDPAAVGALITKSQDASALVRSWAVRGLAKPAADSAGVSAQAEAMLITATRDADRRVRTEAVRALGTYSDSAAVSVLVASIKATDDWIATSAAEGLGRATAAAATPELRSAASSQLVAAMRADRPCALRVAAMQALQPVAVVAAWTGALDVAHDTVSYCRTVALQLVMRPGGRGAAPPPDSVTKYEAASNAEINRLRAARRAELGSPDLATRLGALRAVAAWADSTDLLALLDLQRRAEADAPAVAAVATSTVAAVRRRLSGPPAGQGRPAPTPVTRPLAEYRQIVERWVVPDYNGAPRPTARWETSRGTLDLELYAGDAPLAVDDFVRTMESGVMLGTEFTRVVPDFVAQQQTIRGGNVLRDEVSRHGLTRANLAWATAGLDTGTPGYTLAHTPQPHNEGDFTALGRVIRGMDVVDRLELGDRITAARMTAAGRP